ncbi:MAG: sulfide/dihydroorotate dehydrogenase-like FAD/NAD-binding protein [Deltaproteobacteria bacterium]|jgi:NAD(P)H-flavin reductase|nr:sulfide/dihydroorotate dehydrogenase-like FAD/NAD-binding protein [Deltaproteobacteria bacterium]
MRAITKCIDAGTKYCPCKLAEIGQCIVCSQCGGKQSCSCSNWNGACIYQEFLNNKMKAKSMRGSYRCKVSTVIPFDDVMFVRAEVPYELELELVSPGSFVFARINENPFFDTPISVLFTEFSTGTIGLAVITKGVKTIPFQALKGGDFLFLRGPYFNGIFGQHDLQRQMNGNALVLARGIGFLPSLSVIAALHHQHNETKIFLDWSNFNVKLLAFFNDFFELKSERLTLLGPSGMTAEAKEMIRNTLEENINFIHIGGSDFLVCQVVNFLKECRYTDIRLSCCNNAKLCCGEGICGACTQNDSAQIVRRLCKEQIDPYHMAERNPQ